LNRQMVHYTEKIVVYFLEGYFLTFPKKRYKFIEFSWIHFGIKSKKNQG